ncbi:putative aldouronate transport system permease protein [Scopulibacillus darangshiensis]|uniref:Putative aldouronate transport system permease protein n=1 Tax=Scopulibacillus darangshiensis TaxID=442528 RepID=A0A4R2NQC7_9BACL|nr:putative aldouronate transport system permease protein [Scopulibacillus darangshiensis]
MASIQLGTRKEKATRLIRKATFRERVVKDFKRNKYVYAMLLPVVAYFLIFHYGPMYGVQIAFKNYDVTKGFLGSPWVGFEHFVEFFKSYYFWRLIRNTLLLSLYSLIFVFPAPIIFALLLNEIRNMKFKRLTQTITYLPHFISLVVVVGILVDFLSPQGLINQILSVFGVDVTNYLQEAGWFRTIFISSEVWQTVGWGSIIYLAAITNVNPQLYEAAKIDGAGRFRQIIHVTIPGILPTITILFILQLGSLMTVGYQKIILLYNPLTYETADVISTYIYRKGILDASYSYSAAIGLFDAVINFGILVLANRISKKVGETSLW